MLASRVAADHAQHEPHQPTWLEADLAFSEIGRIRLTVS
jgi:hypothetical protein